jgi:hypothetical protein
MSGTNPICFNYGVFMAEVKFIIHECRIEMYGWIAQDGEEMVISVPEGTTVQEYIRKTFEVDEINNLSYERFEDWEKRVRREISRLRRLEEDYKRIKKEV